MKLVLNTGDFRAYFFEHQDAFSAQRAIFLAVDKHCAKFHDPIESDETDALLDGSVHINGLTVRYAEFIELQLVPNSMFVPVINNTHHSGSYGKFNIRIQNPMVIPFDEWWDKNINGQHWCNLVHTSLKNKVDTLPS